MSCACCGTETVGSLNYCAKCEHHGCGPDAKCRETTEEGSL
jgi:hypothetical protein